MLRSAHAQALPQSRTRARVSKDEDVRLDSPSCFEMHRSARRPRKAPVLASRCDAPQHEGAGARRILAERSQRMLARVVPAKAGTHNHGLGYGSRLSARFAGVGRDEDRLVCASTNLRLCETTPRAVSLFPDCYLQ